MVKLVNRATSLGLLIGVSALFGYQLGANRDWIKAFAQRVLTSIFSPSVSKTVLPAAPIINRSNSFTSRNNIRSKLYRAKSIAENTSDSAIDFSYQSDSENDFEDQFFEMNLYNKYYDDLYSLERPENNYENIQTKTVDKIDQVLHQIDDIKKSIVEIDDELYHVTESKYASFNPDFLILTDNRIDDLEENPKSPIKFNSHRKSRQFKKCQINENLKPQQQITYDNQRRTSSRLSFGSMDNLQLEWDELEYDFCFQYNPNSALNEKTEEHQSTLNSEKSALVTKMAETSMTDEQKLKNLHDLLEEAKHLGLLNNIIDAFLSQKSISKVSSDIEEEICDESN